MLGKLLDGIFAFVEHKPAIITYRCPATDAVYEMSTHGDGFVVEKTEFLAEQRLSQTIALVEKGGTIYDLSRRFLEVVEQDACACRRVAA